MKKIPFPIERKLKKQYLEIYAGVPDIRRLSMLFTMWQSRIINWKVILMSEFKIVGKPIPRHDAWSKVTGDLKYADDFSQSGMLFAKVLRSKYPAAKIISIDTGKAEQLDGVRAVLTAKMYLIMKQLPSLDRAQM